MIEKSEDQVIDIIDQIGSDMQLATDKTVFPPYAYFLYNRAFALRAENLAIKSDLATAVEALQNIHIHRGGILDEELFLKTEQFSRIAQEALGKIGEKKSE